MHIVYMPRTVLNKDLFLLVNPDGMCTTKKLSEGDVVIIRKCPS